MSDENELDEIRRRKLEELQMQAMQQQYAENQQKEYESKKYLIMRKILSPEGRQRLENIRIVRPQYAEQVELHIKNLKKF
jgi:programmed cell death protein 5